MQKEKNSSFIIKIYKADGSGRIKFWPIGP